MVFKKYKRKQIAELRPVSKEDRENFNNMKIFEIREDQAWGPNDRGHVIGYMKALSKKDAMEKLNITHGFIQFFEISLSEYKEKVEVAKRNLKMLDLNQSLVHIK